MTESYKPKDVTLKFRSVDRELRDRLVSIFVELATEHTYSSMTQADSDETDEFRIVED